MKKIIYTLLVVFFATIVVTNTYANPLSADSNNVKIIATFEIESFNISKDGMVSWTSINEQGSLPFIVEQFIFDQWIAVGKVNGVGTPTSNSYSVVVTFHSGENKFRLRQLGENKINKYSKSNSYFSKKEPVTYVLKNKKITFSKDTYFIVYNSYGVIINQGLSSLVDISEYKKGSYSLVYDNKVATFKK
jgi:hypothetical protein